MVNVRNIRSCSYATCTKIPSFNVEASETPSYCKQHADDDMVDVVRRRCLHGPLEDGLTLAVRSNDSKSVAHRSSHGAVGGGSCRVKIESYL